MLFAGNFTEHSRVTDLLDVKFAVPVYVFSFCYEFCIYPYGSSLEIKNHNTAHFMK